MPPPCALLGPVSRATLPVTVELISVMVWPSSSCRSRHPPNRSSSTPCCPAIVESDDREHRCRSAAQVDAATDRRRVADDLAVVDVEVAGHFDAAAGLGQGPARIVTPLIVEVAPPDADITRSSSAPSMIVARAPAPLIVSPSERELSESEHVRPAGTVIESAGLACSTASRSVQVPAPQKFRSGVGSAVVLTTKTAADAAAGAARPRGMRSRPRQQDDWQPWRSRPDGPAVGAPCQPARRCTACRRAR